MTFKNLPIWHPIRIQHRNPSFDYENNFLYELFSRSPRLSRWARFKAFLRMELSPFTVTRSERVDK